MSPWLASSFMTAVKDTWRGQFRDADGQLIRPRPALIRQLRRAYKGRAVGRDYSNLPSSRAAGWRGLPNPPAEDACGPHASPRDPRIKPWHCHRGLGCDESCLTSGLSCSQMPKPTDSVSPPERQSQNRWGVRLPPRAQWTQKQKKP